MIKSPMFNHAVESYQHGIEHYFEGSAKSRKFSLLHIDHSIELFLKEKMVDLGKSIYKGDGKTVSIHEAFSSLSKAISIPEQPRLEEMHDLRNVIQHKGVLPDQSTMDFYAKFSYRFVKRFCNDEFGMPINSILPQIHIVLFEAPEPVSLPEQVSSAIQQAIQAENNIDKVLGLYTAVELAAKHLAAHINEDKLSVKSVLRQNAMSHGVEEKRFNKDFKYLDILRGKILHSDYLPEDNEVGGYSNTVKRILTKAGFNV